MWCSAIINNNISHHNTTTTNLHTLLQEKNKNEMQYRDEKIIIMDDNVEDE